MNPTPFRQGHLFAGLPEAITPETTQPALTREALVAWQQRVARFQAALRAAAPPQQTDLFGTPAPTLPDPWGLPPHPEEFYQHRGDRGEPCIYFVLDGALPAVLYIGQTGALHQRWQGTHDCKRYIARYRQCHQGHNLPLTLTFAFWWDVPTLAPARRRLEHQAIAHWQPPFNQENWQTWQVPFVFH
ncbi:MAG: GIY-YIG nuclease family protein [Oscillatoriales cyanobacterium SM2_1_8]|nr:GIY-YIG nuclease family protein [Oscillatoriales cyanobacterium SM2_1_8]